MKALIISTYFLSLFSFSLKAQEPSCGLFLFRGTVEVAKEGKKESVFLVQNKDGLSEKKFPVQKNIAKAVAFLKDDYVEMKVHLKHIKDDEMEIYSILEFKEELPNPFKTRDEMKFIEKVGCK